MSPSVWESPELRRSPAYVLHYLKTRAQSVLPEDTWTVGFTWRHMNSRLYLKTSAQSALPEDTCTVGFTWRHMNSRLCLKTHAQSALPEDTCTVGFTWRHVHSRLYLKTRAQSAFETPLFLNFRPWTKFENYCFSSCKLSVNETWVSEPTVTLNYVHTHISTRIIKTCYFVADNADCR